MQSVNLNTNTTKSMVGPTDPCLEWGPLEEMKEKSMNRAISMIKLAGELLFITSSRPGMVDN